MYEKIFIYRHTVTVILELKFKTDLEKLKEARNMLTREIIRRGGEGENYSSSSGWSPSGF